MKVTAGGEPPLSPSADAPVLGRPARGQAAALFWCLAALIALHFAVAYVQGTNFYVDLAAYAQGQARLPFQYRALTGWVLRAVLHAAALPASDARLVLTLLVAGAVVWIFASARSAAGSLVGRGVLASAAAIGFAAPLYVMYAAPAYDYRFSYPYDVPSLALFFAAYAAFLRGRLAWCLAWFALACLSRETCLVMLPVVLFWPAPNLRNRLLLAAAMLVLWFAAWVLVHRLYAGNVRESAFMGQIAVPGGMVVELGNNWQDLRDPGSWPALLSMFAWAWLPVLLFWRRIGHTGLQRVILWTTPAWFLLMFTVGRLREVRVFAELTVIYWSALVVILQQLRTASDASPHIR